MNHRTVSGVSTRSTRTVRTLALISLASAAWTASAADLLVPSIHPTIADAAFAANSGDRILIAAGTYAPALINKSRLTVAADGSGPVTISGGGNFFIVGASQVFVRDLSFDGVSLVAAGGANVNILGITISNGGLAVVNNSFAVVGNSSIAAADGTTALTALASSHVVLQGGNTVQGASDAYAAVGIGENSVLNANSALGSNTIMEDGAAGALLLNHGSQAAFGGDAALSGDVIAMLHSSITLGTPEFLLPNVVRVEIAGNVQLSEDPAFVTYDGSAITVNGDVTCEDRESSVSLDDEFVANGSVRCTGFSSFDFRRHWRPFWRHH